jgi:hypothetical protein
MVLGWSILVALVLLGFAAFTNVVMKRTTDKSVTGSYAAMLLISLIGYIYITYKAPQVKSIYPRINSLDTINEEFHRQCASITGFSDF